MHLRSWDLGWVVFDWSASYLSGCYQRISVRECQSEKFNLSCGIPDGSCLSPLLLTIYSSSLIDVVQNHSPSDHCYIQTTPSFTFLLALKTWWASWMPLQLLSVAFRWSGTGCGITYYYWMRRRLSFFWSVPNNSSPKLRLIMLKLIMLM